MKEKKASGAPHILWNSLSLALFLSWIAILLRWEIYPSVSVLPLYFLIPAAIAGYLAAVLLDRFLVRRTALIFGCTAGALMAGLTVLLRLAALPQAALLAIVFALFFGLFFLIIPIFQNTDKSALIVFAGALLFLVLLLSGQSLLMAATCECRDMALICALVGLCGGFAVFLAARKTKPPEDARPASVQLYRSRFGHIVFCMTTYLGCLILSLQIVNLLGKSELAGKMTRVSGALLFVVMLCAACLLIRKERVWQLSYVIFTSFTLGALALLVGPGQILFTLLPLMLLISSLSGMLLFFFAFTQNFVSAINRPFMTGFSYILTFPLAFFFILPVNAELLGLIDPGSLLSLGLVAVVLLASPLFFRSGSIAAEPSGAAVTKPSVSPHGESSEAVGSDFEFSLTGAERRVYEFILLGYSNQQIADGLYISINTVKFHVRNILAKSGLQRKSQLVSFHLQQKK